MKEVDVFATDVRNVYVNFNFLKVLAQYYIGISSKVYGSIIYEPCVHLWKY